MIKMKNGTHEILKRDNYSYNHIGFSTNHNDFICNPVGFSTNNFDFFRIPVGYFCNQVGFSFNHNGFFGNLVGFFCSPAFIFFSKSSTPTIKYLYNQYISFVLNNFINFAVS